MDKNAIKNYAIWARNELIARVSQKALQYGIEKGAVGDPNASTVNGRVLTNVEKQQRSALIQKIRSESFEQVIEEVAYTWFNRFCALRFMEVNDYLPSHVRVFSDDAGAFKPQIMAEAINLEMDGLDMQKVYAFKENDQDGELFKYLVITQCNALNKLLPGMFQRIEDYTELLFPDYLLEPNSAVGRLVNDIPEEDWKDAVQIIGWLYQYYNTELFDGIYDGSKESQNLDKQEIPAATQLFTPDWVCRYMVENSLGRLWLEGHPQHITILKPNWKYYLDEAEQEDSVKEQLAAIRAEYAKIKPEDIKCIDPCEGSGHIVVYMFDVLVQIYMAYGYTATDAVASIVKNNLYGLDIDDRAAQLAYFAVMMKARQYDSRFLNRGIQPHIYSIMESNGFDRNLVEYFENGDEKLTKAMDRLVSELHDAKEYGSILNVTNVDFDALYARFEEIRTDASIYQLPAINTLLPFVRIAQTMAQKYDIVVTNPPYLNSSKFNIKLSEFVKKNYEAEKSDLAMVMLKKMISSFTKPNGFLGAITTVSWMFIKSFEKIREYFVQTKDFVCIVDFGTELFDGKIGHLPVVSWVSRNCYTDYKITAVRLVDFCFAKRKEKEAEFYNLKNRYVIQQSKLEQIGGCPIAYWVNDSVLDAFSGKKLGEVSYPRMGLTTGNNDRHLRLWFEVQLGNIGFNFDRNEAKQSRKHWFPYDKGGDYRKWYGNQSYVVNWFNDGYELQNTLHPDGNRIWAHNFNLEFNFKEHISWNDVTLTSLSFRFFEKGFLFDSAAATVFIDKSKADVYSVLAYLNSVFVNELAKLLNPTAHFKLGDYAKLPFAEFDKDYLAQLVKECLSVAKDDWDSFECSWNFRKHPLCVCSGYIRDAFNDWVNLCNSRRLVLKRNESLINEYFLTFFKQSGTNAGVSEDSLSCASADLERDIKSLISYAVGCMFGRYSLDVQGLAYAGGDWDATKYKTFEADADNIIPICDDEYFEDDIVGRFIEFVKVVYGESTLEDNLQFIANALGGKGSSREIIRKYFLDDFFKDHCNTYQVTGSGKRPIYWLFDSGKKNGFKCLVYMHRYRPDTIARIRTDYVHEQQSRYDTAIDGINSRLNEVISSNEQVRLKKQLAKLTGQKDELHAYEEKIHHLADQMISIDLDDGVKVNYAKFKDVLAKIK